MAPSPFFGWQVANNDFSYSARLWSIFVVAWATFILYITAGTVYTVFFHPLHRLPGPKLWIAFPILRQIATVTGHLDEHMRAFHTKYGEVVRFAPDMVSFITPQAWKDIYGHGHRQLQKRDSRPPGETPTIIVANDADHARFRRTMAHAFSEHALSQQEPLMKVYIDLLIQNLHGVADSGQKADMVLWYNLCTFDLIGDLAFGESFHGLDNKRLHQWVARLFASIKFFHLIGILREYPILSNALLRFVPPSLRKARAEHRAYTTDTVRRRLNNHELNGRGDFMDALQRHRGKADGLSEAEIISNSMIFVIAGSETTATLLCGVTYLLLRNPEALDKVTHEVRSAFATEDEINFIQATSRLPYMLACLDEAFRLYPPVPTGLQRITPPDTYTPITGHSIPPNTFVSVHQSAAYLSEKNFARPTKYIPERWLPENPFPTDHHAVLQPFSTGPRNCIGRNLAYNEMRLILARVLWNFDLELCPESQYWSKQKSYLFWDKPPLMCVLRERAEGKV